MSRLLLLFGLSCMLFGCEQPQVQETPTPQVPDFTPFSEDIITNIHGEINHVERFYAFVNNVHNEKSDNVRIITYTVEGAPIKHDLIFKQNILTSVYDTTEDGFGIQEVTVMTCETIDQTEANTRIDYVLDGCSEEESIPFFTIWK